MPLTLLDVAEFPNEHSLTMNNKNPFAPPQADVADFATTVAVGEKPFQVKLALVLLWIELASRLPTAVKNLLANNGQLRDLFWFSFAIVAVSLGIQVLLIVKISAGRNWARVVALVFWLLTFAGIAVQFTSVRSGMLSAFDWALSIARWAADAAALGLVFVGPGGVWFSRRS